MKKILIIIILITLNFIAFYYLTAYTNINTTFEEISMNLIASIIFMPIGGLIAAYFRYTTILNKGINIPFKKVFIDTCINGYLVFQIIILFIIIMVYFELR